MSRHHRHAGCQDNSLRRIKQLSHENHKQTLSGIDEKDEDPDSMTDFVVGVAGAHIAIAQSTDIFPGDFSPKKIGGG
jgi:hypothetical protein